MKCFLGCEISEDENDKAINGDTRNDLDWQMEEECSAAIADKVEEEYGGGGALVKKKRPTETFFTNQLPKMWFIRLCHN